MIPAQDNILYIGKLITSTECVPPSTAVRNVTDRFFNSAQMDAVALVEGKEPVGLVTRHKLLFTLFRRYGFELYERKPVITIADIEPLMIYEGERLDVAISKALERPAQDIYDEVIVVDDNWHYKGLLSVKQMIIQQSNALANSIVQKEMASEKAKELEKINGDELSVILRSNSKIKDVPIVFYSSNDEDSLRKAASDKFNLSLILV